MSDDQHAALTELRRILEGKTEGGLYLDHRLAMGPVMALLEANNAMREAQRDTFGVRTSDIIQAALKGVDAVRILERFAETGIEPYAGSTVGFDGAIAMCKNGWTLVLTFCTATRAPRPQNPATN